MIFFYIGIFFIGASIASFINATIYRIEKRFKLDVFFTKPSHCEKCKKELTWYELLPILGYILEKGRCRQCNTRVNPYYPISELILGTSFLFFWIYSIPWYLWLCLISFFILSNYDIKDNSVPAKFVNWFLVITFLIWFVFIQQVHNLYLPTIFALFFLILNLFKKAMGFGDILVLLAVGILISYKQFVILFWLGIVLALLYSVYLLIKEKVDIKTAKVPMMPFFGSSFVISVIYGEKIYEILFNLLGL